MVEAIGAKAMMEAAEDELPVIQPSLFPSEQLADRGGIGVLRQFDAKNGATFHDPSLRERGRGRPAGALNKKTAAFRDWVLAKGAHPAEGLVEAYMRPVHVLAAELECSVLEAAKIQIACREAVLPYVESRMPQAVNVSGSGLVQLNINLGGSGLDAVDQGDDGVIRIDGEIIDNQGVS